MTQYVNQFAPTVEKGMLDLEFGSNVISGYAASILEAGQAVKMTTSNGKMPYFTAVTADTDLVFGYVVLNVKKTSYAIGERVEIAVNNSVMYMTCDSTAVAVQAEVMYVVSSGKMTTASNSTKCISGVALDNGTSDELIRIYIQTLNQKRPLV